MVDLVGGTVEEAPVGLAPVGSGRSLGQRTYDNAMGLMERAGAAEKELAAAEEMLAQIPEAPDALLTLQALQEASNRSAQLLGEADEIADRAEGVAGLIGNYEAIRSKIDEQAAAEAASIATSKRVQQFHKYRADKGLKSVEASMRDANAAISKLEKLDPDMFVKTRDEFRVISKAVDPNTREGQLALAMYADYVVEAVQLENIVKQVDLLAQYKKAAEIGSKKPTSEKALTKIYKRQINEGWVAMGEALGEENMLAVAEPLAAAMKNLQSQFDKNGFWESIELANRFFKTYATLTPGFHFRNFVGATFMNFSDGVSPGYTREALKIMDAYKKDPQGYLNHLRRRAANGDQGAARVYWAIEATYGSGASGRVGFGEIGKSNATSKTVRNMMDSKAADFLLENAAVKLSQKVGTDLVEFPIRLAMALHSLDNGMSPQQAINRIKRIHFDYSELSKFDKKMKSLIPFWVFMSRNMPMQLQQMMLKPRAYRMYDSFVRNFGVADMEMLQWQEERGGVGVLTDSSLFGGSQDIVFMPDLQHISMFDDLSKLPSKDDPFRFLSQANPMFRVPVELGMNRKFYSGQPFYEDQNKLQYAALQMVPPLAQGSRLAGVGPYENRSQFQSMLNYLGVPLWAVDEKQLKREKEYRKEKERD